MPFVLNRFIDPASPVDRQVADWMLGGSRWFFELLTNVALVGALQYVANASKSSLLHILYWTALFALSVQATARLQGVGLRVFTLHASTKARVWLDVGVSALIFVPLMIALPTVINQAVNAIAASQHP